MRTTRSPGQQLEVVCEEASRRLEQVLQVELDLAATFADLMDSSRSAERAERLRKNILTAVSTVRHFQERLPERRVKLEILRECAELTRRLSYSKKG